MARRRYQSVNETANADLTSLMDVVFNIISFFVILSAMARFEEDDRVTLPPAVTAPFSMKIACPIRSASTFAGRNQSLAWANGQCW